MQKISPLAGKIAPDALLVNVPQLVTAYFTEKPDPAIAQQRVLFGTSGHRGSSLKASFNETHILAITQAICDYRKELGIGGPLFLGIDTHALSVPAFASAIEVLSANGVECRIAREGEYTPTPVISHAILCHNRACAAKGSNLLADGIVVTPSHNPPSEGGFKYNPPSGGPADPSITNWIEKQANFYIAEGLKGVKRLAYEKAIQASSVKIYDFMEAYINDLPHVVDLEAIRSSSLSLIADPLGGAGLHYWKAIADRYDLKMKVRHDRLDPTFSFMSVDWDGQIRMDPSSSYAMQSLIHLKEDFDVAFACDTDHDRHGIVVKEEGLLSSNTYLAACVLYLFQNRPLWPQKGRVGKTLVSSQMIDYACKKMGREVFEVPVGFKWFVEGLMEGSLCFVCEESAGASFLRFDGSTWTTDKDGIIASLLSAEITAKTGKNPAMLYRELTEEFGQSHFKRFEAVATEKERQKIKNISPDQIKLKDLAGEKIKAIFNKAPGNGELIGGIKVVAETGWFAARPSGTEDIYRIYAESFRGEKEMEQILIQAEGAIREILQ